MPRPRKRAKDPPAQPQPQKPDLATLTPAKVAQTAEDRPFSWKDAFPWPGVVVMMGDRGSGKTATAHWIMEQWHKDRKGPANGAVYMGPRGAQAVLPDWVTLPQSYKTLPQDAVIIIDEGQEHANSRRFQSAANLEIGNLVALSRQRRQLIILIAHQSRKLDVQLVLDSSCVIWKTPTRGHLMFERRELQPFTARALQALDGVKGDKRKWAYALDFRNLEFGTLRTGLASWWCEELSNGFTHLGLT